MFENIIIIHYLMFLNIFITLPLIRIILMEDTGIIRRNFERRLRATPLNFHRYLYSQVDWRDRLIGIKGPKGTGKSTLLLQHIKENFPNMEKVLYVSLDDLWFASNSLTELIEYHYTHGGTHLFLDEVHYYDNWERLLKNLNDNYPEMHIVYTGSPMLKLDVAVADLSRRLLDYTLCGLSFREYLQFEGIKVIPRVSLADLLDNHVNIAREILSDGFKVLPAFEKYLQNGYYPFYKETYSGFALRLQNVVNNILESDYAVIEKVEPSTIKKTKKMFMILAESVPQTPNMSKLYAELDTDRNQGLKMLEALEHAGLISLLYDKVRTLKNLSKPDKIYMDNTNLMYAFSPNPNIGTLRETFFLNQVHQSHKVTYPLKGDFLVDERWLFEIGGSNKSYEQIKDIPNSFLAIDGVETGQGNKIPLWMFGLLY